MVRFRQKIERSVDEYFGLHIRGTRYINLLLLLTDPSAYHLQIISLALGRTPTFNAWQNVSPGPIVDDTEDDDDWFPHFWDPNLASEMGDYPQQKALTTLNNRNYIKVLPLPCLQARSSTLIVAAVRDHSEDHHASLPRSSKHRDQFGIYKRYALSTHNVVWPFTNIPETWRQWFTSTLSSTSYLHDQVSHGVCLSRD